MPVDQRVACAREMLDELGIIGTVEVTSDPGDAPALTRQFIDHGAKTIVAWGGDGTINQVASVVAFQGPALGIVPGGSGNGLARELHIPWEPRQALRVALTGRISWLDAGEMGGRLFFNVAGIGFDAQLAAFFNERTTRGPVGYFTTTLRQFLRYEPQRYEVRAQAFSLDQRAMLVVLANTRQYGSNALIAPLARPDDGLLELVVFPAFSPLVSLWHARRLFSGTAHKVRGVTMHSVRAAEISSDTLDAFHVDGEVVPASGMVSARVRPRAIPIRVP